ncbi:uncharacterized protein N0V96_007022 [Colletotrichum fioriniae]|uniref:uncharacterized protein n=1 Tax=Colletotrichum fioriniae TaxID=710243 RepID=UPI0032DA4B78|nr:hypothetical protein N0V96_007022 [Colletotrichum fioriniae]
MSGPYSQFLDLDNTRDPYAFEDPDIFQDPILNDMSLFGPDEHQQPYNPPQSQYRSPYNPPQSQYQSPYNPPQSQYQSPYSNNFQQSNYQDNNTANLNDSSSSFTKIYKIRAAPSAPEITSLPPQPLLGKFIKIDDSLGPKDDPRRIQAMDYNNHLAAARLRNLKNRNNVAAMRSRNRRDRAAVLRAEDASFAKAECRYWKARAIAAGADPRGWEYLPDVAKEAVAADYRIDALDFFQDVGEVAPATPKKVLAKRKR